MFDDAPVFDVDMNSVRDGNRITTLLEHVESFPLVPRIEMGSWVWVRDEQDMIYAAIVTSVDGRRLRLKIDWTSPARSSYDKASDSVFGVSLPPAVTSGAKS